VDTFEAEEVPKVLAYRNRAEVNKGFADSSAHKKKAGLSE